MFKTYVEDRELDNVVQALPECIVNKKVLRLLLKHQIKQRSEEWYATRKSCLTASDAATALGQNPYKKPIQLIKSKVGFYDNVPPDPQMIKATEHGIKYEDEAAQAYAVMRPDLCPFFELGLIMHEAHPLLGPPFFCWCLSPAHYFYTFSMIHIVHIVKVQARTG